MKKTKKSKAVQGRKVQREIRLPMDQLAVCKKAQKVALLASEISELEVEKKAKNDEYKAKIDAKASERDASLADIRDSKHAPRLVMCTERRNFRIKKVEYFYGGKKVDERELNHEDRQEHLPLKSKSKIKAKGAKKDDEVAAVITSETNKRTKVSAVDGPRA